MPETTIFYTTKAQDIAQSLSQSLGVESFEIYINQFPDSEWYVRVPEEAPDTDVIFVHRLFPNQNDSLLQMFFILSEFSARGQRVVLVVPYFPYAKMHKKVMSGEVVTARSITQWLSRTVEKIVTLDCHFIKREGAVDMWGAHFFNLSAAETLLNIARDRSEDPCVVSPDEGARYLARGTTEHYTLKKVRGEYKYGGAGFQRYARTEGRLDVEGRDVYVLDDMISTGGTMAKAVSLAREAGANSVVAMATHGLFVRGADKKIIESGADEIIVTNSIISPYSKVDISPLIASYFSEMKEKD